MAVGRKVELRDVLWGRGGGSAPAYAVAGLEAFTARDRAGDRVRPVRIAVLAPLRYRRAGGMDVDLALAGRIRDGIVRIT